jgi:spore coat polysaccharide biosynthesis protein SpsF (cytidylyltransferase family)
MKPVAIIQARMSSTRLPGKVLMPLAGKPVLAHVVERLAYCRTLQGVLVATSTHPSDDAIEQFCSAQGIRCYRGSLDDVLDRYYQSALLLGADPIVRITADCPAIDPVVVDAVVAGFLAGNFDLYGLAGEFPDGLDCTVFGFSALERAWKEARLRSEREHVGPYIENHPELFRNGGLHLFHGLAHQRWTLDEPRDFQLLRAIFDRLYTPEKPFLAHEVLEMLSREPELMAANSGIVRNAGYLKSLESDGVETP